MTKKENAVTDFEYTKKEGGISIKKYNGKSKKIVIPSQIKNLPVIAIGDRAFFNEELTSVTIPNSVTTIGVAAFHGNKLTSVTIPDSIISIGDWAFWNNKLTSVNIPDSVTSIGNQVFCGNRLTSVTIPNSITSIGNQAFCSNRLTSITIPNSVTSIGDWAFRHNQLTSITIPDSATTIGVAAFRHNQLTSITIPDSVTSIGDWAFHDNPLTSINLPGNVTIQRNSFYVSLYEKYIKSENKKSTFSISTKACDDFEITVLDGSVAEILKYTGNAKDVTIPEKLNGLPVISIGEDAFSKNKLTRVTIPNSVLSIEESAFAYNKLTSVIIPNSVIFIGELAFAYNKLTSVTIPNSVTFIGELAFYTNQLTSITIPNSVTSIGDHAFYYNQLTSVTIPNSITCIGEGAFDKNVKIIGRDKRLKINKTAIKKFNKKLYLVDMYNDKYFPKFLVDKIKVLLMGGVELLETGEQNIEKIQDKFDKITIEINNLEGEFEENNSEIETVARESIGQTVDDIIKHFDLNIDGEELIRERDW